MDGAPRHDSSRKERHKDMRNKNEKNKGFVMGLLPWVLGFAFGSVVIEATHNQAEDEAYRRGRADGIQECQKPSKLEKAAKWMSN